MSEQVNHPKHYGGQADPYESIKVIEAWDLGFCLGNTVKYISRAGKKDPDKTIQDLEKARWYLDREIQKLKDQKRAEVLEKCADQECKKIPDLPKTPESMDKIFEFIGLREANIFSKGNKDVIFKKYMDLNSTEGAVVFYRSNKDGIKYTPGMILSDWKNNCVKPYSLI